MKLKNSLVLRQRQSQKTKLIYAASATMILALIAVFTFVFNVGNVRKGFAASGTTYTAVQSGNWNASTTWSPVGVPTSNDDVIIASGFTVTVNIINAAANSLTLGGFHSRGTITFATSGAPSLTVTNGITEDAEAGATGIITMQSGATISASSYDNNLSTTFTSGTVIYAGAGSVVNATYNNLSIAAGLGTATFTGTTTVSGDLTIANGTLDVASKTLYMKGNFVNNGTFISGTGTVTLEGTAAQSFGGNADQSLYNLKIDNTSGVTLSASLTITHTLTMATGILTLGDNKLTIGPSGNISSVSLTDFIETNGTGVLEMTASHTAGTVFPVGIGYNPIIIKPTTDAVFDVSMANALTDKLGNAVTSHAVNVTWTLQIQGSAQNVVVTPEWYSSDELTSFTRSTSYVSSRTSPTGTWAPSSAAGAATGTGPYKRLSGSISMASANSYFIGVGDNVSALPVTLVSFNATYEDKKVNLDWETASEINNNYFEIERSTDGETWQAIGREQGHGNSSVTQNYTSTDDLAGIIPAGEIYYRLKQVDFNGASTFSMIRSVAVNSTPSTALSVYPNPTIGELNITWNSEDNSNATLRLVNISGATLYTENVNGIGAMHKQVDLSAYKPGTYFVQIVTDKNTSSQTVIKR